MSMCTDTINVVRKASRDLKIKSSLSRRRVATSRSTERGTFTVQSHMSGTQQDFNYERNSVTKSTKVYPMGQGTEQ